MKISKFIYWYESKKYYLVKFTFKGKTVQRIIPVTKNRTDFKALEEAIKFRNANIDIRKLKSPQLRSLSIIPSINKKDKRFPSGISYITSYRHSKTKKIYSCNKFNITLGYDNRRKMICKYLNVNHFQTMELAIEEAVKIREELKVKYNKY